MTKCWLLSFCFCMSVMSVSAQPRYQIQALQYALEANKTLVDIWWRIDVSTLQQKALSPRERQVKAVLSFEVVDSVGNPVATDRVQTQVPIAMGSDIRELVLTTKQQALLGAGTYEIRLLCQDAVSGLIRADTGVLKVRRLFSKERLQVSDLLLLQSYSLKQDKLGLEQKHGVAINPLLSEVVGRKMPQVGVFAELYPGPYLDSTLVGRMRVYKLPEAKPMDEFGAIFRLKPKGIVPIFKTIDVSALPSGKYTLQLEILNAKGQFVGRNATAFTRANPPADTGMNAPVVTPLSLALRQGQAVLTNMDSQSILTWFDRAFPITSQAERENIKSEVKGASLAGLRAYFLEFWKRRDPNEPEQAFVDYKLRWDEAMETYGKRLRKRQKLWQLDRGRVFLQYGKPNQIVNETTDQERVTNSASNRQYELWRYYRLEQTGQRDVIFVFAPDAVNVDDYKLLHSTALGEMQNTNWRMAIQGTR